MAGDHERGADWKRLRGLATVDGLRGFVKAIVSAFLEHDLLTAASAIAFQTLFALIPLALAGVALLGFLDLEDVWQEDVAPTVRDQTSEAGYTVIENTVERILGEQRGFWLTLGAGLMVWYVSGGVRAVMGTLNRIYGVDEERSFVRRFAISFGLAVAVAVCLGLSTTALHFGSGLVRLTGDWPGVGVLGVGVRWGLAILPMLVLMGMMIRYAPARAERSAWTGVGAALVTVGWIGASLVFGWYVTSIASYQSVFGGFASAIVLMTYLYIVCVVFLVGVQVDALLRAQAGAETDVLDEAA